MLASLILAVRFLTVAPVPGREAGGPDGLGRAAWWFPVVGLALGGALACLDRVLTIAFPPLLAAGLVLSLWKGATGAIHLDGLADCLDGLGGRDPEHRRTIMHDGRIGAFGATGLVLVLLIAFLALAGMAGGPRGRVLVLAPVIGRLVPLLVGSRLHAATPGDGMGAAFAARLSRWAGPTHLVAVSGGAMWLLGGWGVVLSLSALAAALIVSVALASRLGGLSGDLLGAGVELGEVGVLVMGASLVHASLI